MRRKPTDTMYRKSFRDFRMRKDRKIWYLIMKNAVNN